MGITIKTGDLTSPLAEYITENRAARDNAARDRVRRGEMTVDDYLMGVKGFSPDMVKKLRGRAEKAIFDEERS